MNGEPRRMTVSPVRPKPETLDQVEGHLRSGGILAYPTETVYGLGCRVRPEALRRLFALKERDLLKPVLLLVTREVEANGLEWSEDAMRLADAFWPGPLTLILADPDGVYPPGVRSGAGGVAVRMTPYPLVIRMVERLGEPITSTSANGPGEAPARSGREALEVARTLGGGDDVWILDVGPLAASTVSTVVDCMTDTPQVRRQGAIPSEDIFTALGRP